MRGKVPTPLVAALAILLLPAAPALAVDPATIANAGTATVVACASCHGKDGGGMASFPRLAGMNAAYLLRQLQDFDSGSRGNAVMKPIATALSPADRNAMANYYAALPIPAALAGAAAPATLDTSPGARLANRGMWSKGVPACVQCHGPGGVGVGAGFPAIAGQPSGYLASQLQAWQKGTRKNDPLELMQHLSRSLSDAEIKAVSEWFARQPAAASGAGS
ncbi:MAG TPA: c-type cytochrome [Lysobacter sp.]